MRVIVGVQDLFAAFAAGKTHSATPAMFLGFRGITRSYVQPHTLRATPKQQVGRALFSDRSIRFVAKPTIIAARAMRVAWRNPGGLKMRTLEMLTGA
jgi:hypothetical protein